MALPIAAVLTRPWEENSYDKLTGGHLAANADVNMWDSGHSGILVSEDIFKKSEDSRKIDVFCMMSK